jgi:hypothetical protein
MLMLILPFPQREDDDEEENENDSISGVLYAASLSGTSGENWRVAGS